MERRPRKSLTEPAYPQDAMYVDRRQFMRALGAFGMAAAAVSVGGCYQTAGGIGGGEEGRIYLARLPAEQELRELAFDGSGSLKYYIEATTESYPLYAYMINNVEDLTLKTDEVLLSHPFSELTPEADLATVEAELRLVLTDAYAAQADASAAGLVSLRLFISDRQSSDGRPL